MQLTDPQLKNLIELSGEWVRTLEVQTPPPLMGETTFTGTELLPWLRGKVSGLNKPGLYVRGDGGPAVQPLIWEGVTFYPDLTIVTELTKYLAFEVKLLRDVDPGGAYAKAIGQATLYANLGYSYSYALIFDLRGRTQDMHKVTWSHKILETEATSIHLYK